jgi:hypothetical protein
MSVSENEKVWVAYFDDNAYGPLSAIEIKRALIEGSLKNDDCIWKKGWSNWKQPKDIPLYAYESQKAAGSERGIPDIPVPLAEDFESIITPQVSAKELGTIKNWDGKRLTIVGGSYILAGSGGALLAGGLTHNTKERKEELARDQDYLDPKNK